MASRSLGTLTLDLVAKIGGYTEPLDRAQRRTRSTSDSISRDMRRVGLAVAAAGAAAVAGTAVLIKSQINLADELGKTAERLGSTTEELSALRYAAEVTGVESNTLDMALQRMTRRLAEAAQGAGEAQGAIEQLGLDAEELAQMTPGEAFRVLADEISKIPDASERVRLAFKFFDSEGVKLVNTLNLGSEGLKEYGDEAERLGLIISQDTAKAAAEFNDNLTRLQGVVAGTGQQLAAELLPKMIEFTDLLKDPDTQASIQAIVTGIADIATAAVRATSALVNMTTALSEGLARAIHGTAADDVPALVEELTELDARIARLSSPDVDYSGTFGPLDEYIAKLKEQRDGIQFLLDLNNTYEASNEQVAASVEDVTQAATDQVVAADGMTNAWTRYVEALNSGGGSYAGFLSAQAAGMNEVVEIQEEMINGFYTADATGTELLARLYGLGQLSYEEYVRGIQHGAESVAGEEGSNPFDPFEEFALEAARNIQDTFADFLYDPFEDGIEGMADKFVDVLRRIAAEAAAQQILTSLFGGLSGSGNAFLSGLGSAFGGARAEGGPTMPGRAYLVGERGPELWVPNAHGQVISNDQSMGGPVIEGMTFNFPGVSNRTEAREAGAAAAKQFNAMVTMSRRYS